MFFVQQYFNNNYPVVNNQSLGLYMYKQDTCNARPRRPRPGLAHPVWFWSCIVGISLGLVSLGVASPVFV